MNTATLDKPADSKPVDSAAIVGTFENLFRLVSTETTELVFVRHAEPDYGAAGSGDGSLDPPLTERGRYQSIRLAQRLRGSDIHAVYTSTSRRAIETAALITAANEAPMIRTPQLCEVAVGAAVVSNGAADGPQKVASQVLARFLHNPRWDAIKGMEPSRQFRHRVLKAIQGIVEVHQGQRVVVVTHAGVINAAVSAALGIQRDMFFLPEHASISVVRFLRDLNAVQCLNDFSHLRPTSSTR